MLPKSYRESVEREHQPLILKAVGVGLVGLTLLWLRFSAAGSEAIVEAVEISRDGIQTVHAGGQRFTIDQSSPLYPLHLRAGDKVTINEYAGRIFDESEYQLDTEVEVLFAQILAIDSNSESWCGWVKIHDTLRPLANGSEDRMEHLKVGDTVRVLKQENVSEGARYVADL